jgi:hypothetical protein
MLLNTATLAFGNWNASDILSTKRKLMLMHGLAVNRILAHMREAACNIRLLCTLSYIEESIMYRIIHNASNYTLVDFAFNGTPLWALIECESQSNMKPLSYELAVVFYNELLAWYGPAHAFSIVPTL